jgi:thiol-disulfide isomerase/thioredoxin
LNPPCLLFAFISFILFPNYFIYYHNHNAEKNIPFSKVTLLNDKKEKIELQEDKIIVLDFWSTSCGICFEKFPNLEDTFQKYKNNSKVQIYTVNVPLQGEKFEETTKILDSIGYNFPKLYAQSAKEVETKLNFNLFPHLIVIKNGKIRYDGQLVTEKSSLIYNIETEIDKLLKEN